jgi:predicted MFS family arabinose efflux permease
MRLIALVTGVGIAQIASWGSLYYAIGVLGKPMREDLGVSELFVFTAFTVGLLLSGTLAPWIGRSIDRLGGRRVLAWGSVASAIALAILALAPNAIVMTVGWLVAGAAMSASLYDPAFATLSQHSGSHYRRAVTSLTLLGGFASTVSWPLSHYLLEAHGWRWTLGAYAAFQIVVCLPLHLAVIPRGPHASHRASLESEVRSPAFSDSRLPILRLAFALGAFITGVVGVHMVGLLSDVGLTAAEAVTIAMLMGPMQVAGRIVELAFSRHVRAVTAGLISFALIGCSVAVLALTQGMGAMAILFVTLYGCGNGVMTIVRGTAPVELYGREGLGELLGYFARVASYAKAIAPAAWPALLAMGLGLRGAIGTLALVAFAGLAGFAFATRWRAGKNAQHRL